MPLQRVIVEVEQHRGERPGIRAVGWAPDGVVEAIEHVPNNPFFAANVLRLFQQHPSLGMVFPPVYHVGYPTLGHAWFLNKGRAEEAQRARTVIASDCK